MQAPCYHFLLTAFTPQGEPLGESPITPDWYPAVEAARWHALRSGHYPRLGERIEPLWNPKAGAPYLAGVTVVGEDATRYPLPLSYFHPDAQRVMARLLQEGLLQKGESILYQVSAFPKQEQAPDKPSWASTLQEVWEVPLAGERPLAVLLTGASLVGKGAESAGTFPVFIRHSLLVEAEALMAAAEDKETGGVLVGYLYKDTPTSEVFAELTGLIPLEYSIGTSTRLTFTPQTWEAIHKVLLLRNRGEVILSWWHTHPARHWCKCGEEAQRTCHLGEQFFSETDLALQRTIFPRAFQSALVTGERPCAEGGWERVHTLYGWREGSIATRNFWLRED